MASTVPFSGGWTYQKYLELHDENRYEILGGELTLVPAPSTSHQRISARLYQRFAAFVAEWKRGEVLYSPVDVVLEEDEVVQPDILFVRSDRIGEIVKPNAIHGAPDLVVEILSPSSLYRDRHEKSVLYQRVGVREYWIVDPANRGIEVLKLGESGYELFSSAAERGAVASAVLLGLAVDVAEIFSGPGA